MSQKDVRSGGCLCGAVRFEIEVPEPKFTVCHCGMCRRWSAGPFLSVHCADEARFSEDSGLAWYQGSQWAERGFCKKCGTSLFWRLAAEPRPELVVSVEAFDDADDMKLDRHIFIDAKPKRYDFSDTRPRLTEAELMAELGITPP